MSRNLLVVEDIRFVNAKICSIGKQHGYTVHAAGDLQTALRFMSDIHFDLAIIDYRLPDGDNGEAVDYAFELKIPTIVITAKIDDELRENILSKNIVDYFQKDAALTFDYIDRMLSRLDRNPEYSVLVVDDSSTARVKLVRLLKRHRFKVLEAANGREALEIVDQDDTVKVIITDHEMPEMDGIELTRELRIKYQKDDIAIIGISSKGNSAMSARFLKYGANDFLTKPFCEEEFYCRLSHNIDSLEQLWQIKKSANTDFLTQLNNRRHLSEIVEGFGNYGKKSINLAMLDIDHFKRINDGFGHDVGDLALQQLSAIMKKHFTADVPARFGGEEFCIVSENLPPMQFRDKLEEFRLEVQNTPLVHNGQDIKFTVSIGAVYSKKSLADMLVDADTLLYKAKKTGRNKVITE